MASITLTFNAQQTALLASAIGSIQGLGRDATLAEAKTWFNEQARNACRAYQIGQAEAAAAITNMDST